MTPCRVPVGLAGISLALEEAFLSLVFLSADVIFSAGNALLCIWQVSVRLPGAHCGGFLPCAPLLYAEFRKYLPNE